jgi:hypothetical protein
MSFITRRLLGVAASTVLLSLVSATAHAQLIDVVRTSEGNWNTDKQCTTVYTFSSSMILNSIGFLTRDDRPSDTNPFGVFEYSIGTGSFQNVPNSGGSLLGAVNGVRWLNLETPITLSAGQTVSVRTSNTWRKSSNSYESHLRFGAELNASANVSSIINYEGTSPTAHPRDTNSSLRVSNPSSNVAPEPGTFALALTGGGALIGICIRRRRNAA